MDDTYDMPKMHALFNMILVAVFMNLYTKLFGAWFPLEQMGAVKGLYMISPMVAMFPGTATTALFPSEASAFIFFGRCLPSHSHPLADPRQEQARRSA